MKFKLTSPRPKLDPESKPQIPKSQIQKQKGEFGLGLPLKSYGPPPPTIHPTTLQLFEGLSWSTWGELGTMIKIGQMMMMMTF